MKIGFLGLLLVIFLISGLNAKRLTCEEKNQRCQKTTKNQNICAYRFKVCQRRATCNLEVKKCRDNLVTNVKACDVRCAEKKFKTKRETRRCSYKCALEFRRICSKKRTECYQQFRTCEFKNEKCLAFSKKPTLCKLKTESCLLKKVCLTKDKTCRIPFQTKKKECYKKCYSSTQHQVICRGACRVTYSRETSKCRQEKKTCMAPLRGCSYASKVCEAKGTAKVICDHKALKCSTVSKCQIALRTALKAVGIKSLRRNRKNGRKSGRKGRKSFRKGFKKMRKSTRKGFRNLRKGFKKLGPKGVAISLEYKKCMLPLRTCNFKFQSCQIYKKKTLKLCQFDNSICLIKKGSKKSFNSCISTTRTQVTSCRQKCNLETDKTKKQTCLKECRKSYHKQRRSCSESLKQSTRKLRGCSFNYQKCQLSNKIQTLCKTTYNKCEGSKVCSKEYKTCRSKSYQKRRSCIQSCSKDKTCKKKCSKEYFHERKICSDNFRVCRKKVNESKVESTPPANQLVQLSGAEISTGQTGSEKTNSSNKLSKLSILMSILLAFIYYLF